MGTKIDHAAACRFFSAEEACTVALSAYYAASADNVPDDGEPWQAADGTLWDDGSTFFRWFLYHVAAKITARHVDNLPPFFAACSDFGQWAENGVYDVLDAAGLNRPEGKTLPPEDNALHNDLAEACRRV